MTEETGTSPEEQPDVTIAAGSVSDGVYTLLVADFSDPEMAMQAYDALKAVEDGRTVEIEGVIVVQRSDEGELRVQKATDHSTRSGLRWGVVGGVALGIIFPPSVLGSAAALGAGGAAVGKARQMHHKKELADELEDAIEPGHSGIVALVSDPGAVEIQKALDRAGRIVQSAVDDVVAKDIKAVAKEVQSGKAD